ncbi:MAG: diguanylate cyclase [Proteobacteria bacterium]|nr:diguanylate cyclase [Pseudomonadota bacterium]
MRLSTPGFYSRRSLNEWLYVSLVLFIFGSYIAYSLVEDHRRIETRETERLTNQAKVVAENLGRQLTSTNLALAGVLKEIPDWRKPGGNGKQAGQHLRALADAMPGVLTMLIVDANGTVTASDKPELVGRNVAHREYFKTVKRLPNPNTLYVSIPFLTSRGNFTMNLVRLIPGPDGRFDGVVVASLDPDEFNILLNSVLHTTDMNASLIHGDGMLFLTVPDRKGLVGFDQGKPSSFFTRQINSDRKANVFTGTSYPMADESMIAMVTIQPPELAMDKPLVIAVGRKLPAVYAEWKRMSIQNGGLFGVVTLFAILGLIYYQKQWRTLEADVSHQRMALEKSIEALRVSDEHFRNLTKLTSDWYWEQDDQFRFVRLHGKLDQRTSIANEAHVGKTRWEIGALNLGEADWERHRAVLQAHQEFHDFEMQRRDKAGKLYWVSISGMPLFDGQGQFRGYQGVARDISLHKSAEEEIKRLAFYDSLTQLPNRRLLNDRLGHALAASKRSKCFGALMFLDLDNFKPLNDLHGHAVGDLLLIEVARRITGCLREMDTVGRFGGDEFAVIVGELDTDPATAKIKAEKVAEKIHSSLADPYVLIHQTAENGDSTVTHRCTASIGITLFSDHMAPRKEILKQADMAMYQAKADGRNLIRFYDPNT